MIRWLTRIFYGLVALLLIIFILLVTPAGFDLSLKILKKSLPGKLSYDNSVWYIDWSNFQTSVTYFGVTTDGNAKDGITAYGFDSSLKYQPNQELSLNLGIAYSNSTLNSNEPGLFGLEGARVPRIPKWTVSGNMIYNYSLFADWDSWLSVGVSYVGSSPSAFVNGADDITQYNLDSDAYALVDASTAFELDGILISLYINNVLANDAYTNYQANDTVGVIGVPLSPRTVGISLTYSF